ncbi:MFS transporter [Caballeronia sp. GAWG2-1]|uniref:MFS transporter n=1 Tax=Caballeronia sp. GAWG2-1 TaxID=2921744 RepID=UPI0020279B4E|nr:MFS transporter [Caballeronia sp. GAWG2-1]
MVSHVLGAAGATSADDAHAIKRKKAVLCTVVGSSLEFFDFACYAYFATVISHQFFSPTDHATALIASFAVFGIGFVSRPLGAIFFGRLGDLKGRKFALLVALPMMGAATVAIGLLPTYSAIGLAAPLLLVLCRLIQGFSTGGEAGNAVAYLVEWAPPQRRGFYSSFAHATAVSGTLVGSGLAAILSTTLDYASLEAWGWRIPFLFGGLVIAPIGYYLRSKVEETPRYVTAVHDGEIASEANRVDPAWRQCLKAIAFSSVWFVSYYVYMVYVPAFLTLHGHIRGADALWITTAGFVMMVICILAAGLLSDAIGRKPPLLAGAIGFVFFSYPLFLLFLHSTSVLTVLLAILFCNALIGLIAGSCTAAMAEMFPTRLRTTGVSIGYGLSVTIFGGFASVISELLIKLTGSELSPSFFVIATALVSLSVVVTLKETAHKPLVD